MEGFEVQAIWGRIKAEHESKSRPPFRRRKFEFDDDVSFQEQIELDAMCDEDSDME